MSKLHYLSFLISLLVGAVLFSCGSSEDSRERVSPAYSLSQLEQAYAVSKEESVQERRFLYADVLPLIAARGSDKLAVSPLGKSVEGQQVYQLDYGKGPVKVMLWSQMHGNESTATMALFDLFNFLEGEQPEFAPWRELLHERLQLKFIPVVNPDGADRWIRRNALDIDLNRDAIAQVSSEARFLKAVRDSFEPDFGFNLHDQQTYYNVKGTANPATISVLAPAYNAATEVNAVREAAMQVIVGMHALMQEAEPDHVGKYNDAFEPRAFGDNFQKWGTSTILIESGGYPNDPEKQVIRKYNFMLMLQALLAIATEEYKQQNIADYYAIPDNDLKLMDLVLRDVQVELAGQEVRMDLGVKRREVEAAGGYFVQGVIDDMGDLSVFYGYEELEGSALRVREAEAVPEALSSLTELSMEQAMAYLRAGQMALQVKGLPEGLVHPYPLLLSSSPASKPAGISLGAGANFFLEEGGELRYAVVNGYLIDLAEGPGRAMRMRSRP
ncbi:peptidase M14 carboxypeptidase A [Nitritalea halalkaliphila LW7]|uniref:Peptidase M14 carboxypeptidase A n=1 Tax=Nitritalea halalkaliphila LW7 TaxID=1189621 RepID=I5BVN4_9BACT|nr:M14 family zinc carboxypeptidase [Nitritalea halalkaliphila]EIM73636.1 peptidase M14 carboxypeptidase A [Nitritalea halalkaliphila LW7]